MKIIKVPISSVIPWDKNPRTADEKDLVRLRQQIEKLGFYKPLLGYKAGVRAGVSSRKTPLKEYER